LCSCIGPTIESSNLYHSATIGPSFCISFFTGDVIYLQDVADAISVHKAFPSRLPAQATLSGKTRNLGHQEAWIAVESTFSALLAFLLPLGFHSGKRPWHLWATMSS